MSKKLPRVQAAIALIERQGRLLICRRPRDVTFAGYWEFPGGKRHRGESWAACARREVREEVGLRLRSLRYLCTLQHTRSGQVYELQVFESQSPDGNAQPFEAQEVKWVKPSALRRYRFPPANAPLIRQLSLRCRAKAAVL